MSVFKALRRRIENKVEPGQKLAVAEVDGVVSGDGVVIVEMVDD